jgi:hypothetical protein
MTTQGVEVDHPYSVLPQRTESLAFRVRLATSTADIVRAVAVRSSAYGRHVPAVGAVLRVPEPDDSRNDVLLVIAESKLDRAVLGSIRLQPNFHQPLRLQTDVTLPDKLTGRPLVEFMRLTVTHGLPGRLVMAALAKASFEICHRTGVEYILVAGRQPVSLMYESMQFDDLLGGGTVNLSYAAGLPHGIYCLPVRDADRRWRTAAHSLYPFMAHTEHPDIEIDYSSDLIRRFQAL